MSVRDILMLLNQDRAYHEASGGGLTVSGGEPTDQADFLLCLLNVAKQEGFHTCLDTCGVFAASLITYLLPVVDLFLLDYKAPPEIHKQLTGVNIDPVMATLESLLGFGAQVHLRCPLVPGVNDSEEHLEQIAKLSDRVAGIEILPYKSLAMERHQKAGIPFQLNYIKTPTAVKSQRWLDKMSTFGARNVGLG